MAQTYTSAGTSINSTRLPAVFGKITYRPGGMLLDYGCGKHVDHIRSAVTGSGMAYLPYDPYNQPDEVNRSTVYMANLADQQKTPLDVVCSNVLNVIDDDHTVRSIVHFITVLVEHTGGTAYFTVYEGDRSGVGRRTGKDQYQRNQPLSYYTRFFDRGRIERGMIVVH